MKQKVWSILSLICLLAIFSFNLVAAVDFNQDISDEDKAAFDRSADERTRRMKANGHLMEAVDVQEGEVYLNHAR